jgi:hypothetical protein
MVIITALSRSRTTANTAAVSTATSRFETQKVLVGTPRFQIGWPDIPSTETERMIMSEEEERIVQSPTLLTEQVNEEITIRRYSVRTLTGVR